MELTSQNSPLTDEQARQLNELLKGLEDHQVDWLSGYLAGWRAAQTGQPAAGAAAAPAPGASAEAPSLTILYGSQTGNAEGVAEMLGEQASARGINVKIVDMADYKPRQLKSETFVAVLASTHGEGDPPDNALDFHEFLHGRKAPGLKGVNYGVLALGDTTYEHFCQTGKDFDTRFEELGATRLTERVDCDVDYDDPAEAWIESILGAIEEKAGATAQTAGAAPGAGVATAKARYDRRNPFPAPVLENLVLNGRGSNKETRHLEFSLEESGLHYQPGDAVGVYPQNNPKLVAAIIEKLGLDPDESVSLGETETTLSEALQHYREITVLTLPLMEQWAAYSGDDELQKMVDNHSTLTEWMRGRDLLDLIETWPVEALGADTLTGMLRKLPPRLYSIASSQAQVEDEVHVTVAAVRYETHGREREGVASTWLSDRIEDDATVPVYIDPNKNFKLPDDDDAPIIMVGPGTGVAPFRAFMQEREERGAKGRNWLFFGEQQFRADFLYQAEWLNWRRQGLLDHITVAFSRDQEQKVYVQHRIREQSTEIWSWLQDGAYLYVCGDADAMAPDVNEALIDVIAEEGGKSREEATEYLRELAREKRYQRDVY
ncbi:assimilatory sulfite reductase (NADPH) flavoprotein subunit [Marinobacter sp. TBZ242]|uniref:Sulfite reductase [NADPH] flavoprotein alpha-component n=1 Tax=Marinobacter azerbaijanicus TaxID=3050455 RepID=A0ABT7IGI2_9GAMM|nr:assimilatory sulfite reductase (NADPH) flavoprotein subunit [Marinobacter sp. TBZ242]MDL0433282.1 assimilatory sulfite reductase (NADPH) flavoprotein subunit [Marinobacter sp. TBZ242]